MYGPDLYGRLFKKCGSFGRPKWCEKKFCWVDPNSCDSAYNALPSSFFPGSGAYYSYETCGAASSFESFTGAKETVQLVENYVRAIKCEMETNIVGKVKSGCTGLNDSGLCKSLDSCHKKTGSNQWAKSNIEVNFSKVNTVNAKNAKDANNQKCVEDAFSASFLQIANSEYDTSKKAVGYMYAGQQSGGEFTQWPAIQWDLEDGEYDPRFRPWYSIVASGPKDIVLVIDQSGSMAQKGRLDLAKQAAKAVLKTLTWVDFVTVLAFGDQVTGASAQMVQATDNNKDDLIAWIDSLQPTGTTNFRDSLKSGFKYLVNARKQKGCASSYCVSALLFLTDGKPDDFTDADVKDLEKINAECKDCVRLFSYALGSGAEMKWPETLAKTFDGEMQVVGDNSGPALANAMSKYYELLVVDRDTSLVRWVEYNDAASGAKLLAGCVAIDDLKQSVLQIGANQVL